MFEVCICKLKYPKNDTQYYLYNNFENAINELKRWLKDGKIKQEDIYYIKFVKEK